MGLAGDRPDRGSWNDKSAELRSFLDDLRQEILIEASSHDEEELAHDVFIEWASQTLSDLGEADDIQPAYVRGHGFEAAGYAVVEDEGRLDLLVTHYAGSPEPVSIPPADVRASLSRLKTFLERSQRGLHEQMEEASSAYDMALRLWETKDKIDRVRLFYVTDGRTNIAAVPDDTVDGVRYSTHVWDLVRLHRASTSGRTREPISVRLPELGFEPIPCVVAPHPEADYTAYLAIMPGRLLAELYLRFGPRLLERNIRSFLQVRGKINAGIRQTIINEPHHFLAYNNGISITASGLGMRGQATTGIAIEKIDDLQIVNGGQTTASIYSAWRRDRAELKDVSVAAKITVVPPALLDEFVPSISRYANSQNRINEADFSANDPYHVDLEKLSRATWAPSAIGGQQQSKWFYERARGQYQDELAREETPARQRNFKVAYPPAQRFTKTDLAKFEHSWLQLPQVVSMGAEKNFKEFALRLKERTGSTPVDLQYYQRLIAKAILFRQTEKIVSAQKFGGYRANIVAYSVAYLSHRTAQRIDLDAIWAKQAISGAIADSLERICVAVHASITNPPGGRNVTEWSKKDQCWERVRELTIQLTADLDKELVVLGRSSATSTVSVQRGLAPAEEALVGEVAKVPSDVWFALSNWARQTSNLAGWQRSLAFSLGRLASSGRPPSVKQATHARRILDEARRLGFDYR